MQKSTVKQLVFEILFALLLLFLLVAVLVTELSRASNAYFYERTDLVTYTEHDELVGYLFRDEIAPDTWNNGPIDYRVQDGASVQAGDVLAHVYRDDSGTDKRERAAALYAQIAELESALAVPDWKDTYLTGYTAMMRELSTGNTAQALVDAQITATAIQGRDAQGDREQILARIAELQAQLDALTAHANDYKTTTADTAGIFYRQADGYEALFGINQVEHLTPASLNALLAAQPKLDTVIGKLVCHGPWYLAVPTDRALAATYTANKTYPVQFGQESVTMTLERIYTDDTENALLIFAAEEMPAWLSPMRRQNVRVVKGTVSGLCIPADALSQDNTIFVLKDGVACLRQVTPAYSKDGCLLITPDETGGLAEGEYVIVSTKQLFDGKVLE